jgi:hypothetical protein
MKGASRNTRPLKMSYSSRNQIAVLKLNSEARERAVYRPWAVVSKLTLLRRQSFQEVCEHIRRGDCRTRQSLALG